MDTVRLGLLSLVILSTITVVSAQSPNRLSFQGYLTDAGGNPINNASQSITFALYKGATKIWQETQSVNVVDGLYNVMLGSVVPTDTIRFNSPIELGVKVGADAEMTPRTPLGATAVSRSLPGFHTYYSNDGFISGYNIIGGHSGNHAHFDVVGGTISGGGSQSGQNVIIDDYGTVGGGEGNSSAFYGTASGGVLNRANGFASTISGGNTNVTAGSWSTVGGGLFNRAYGETAVVPGGNSNYASGYASFAAGYRARAKHNGTFVWNDRSLSSGNDSLLSTAENQFIIRAANGVGINKAPVGKGIHLKMGGSSNLFGIRIEYSADSDYWDTFVDESNDYNFAYNGTLLGYIDHTDGEYFFPSDATLKEDIKRFGTVLSGLLELKPSTYRFRNADPSASRAIGLVAQEVEPLFPELVSEKDGIKALNYAGVGVVAVKAIQELHALVRQLEARILELEANAGR